MSGQKVMAAMSGGVDSSVTALLLARQGYEVCGGTLLLWQGENPQEQSGCCALSEVEDARRVCARLGVEHYTFNLKDVFCREVIDRFAEGYRRGETPNPCVDCNRSVKFTRLFEKASLLDCEFLATGTTPESSGRKAPAGGCCAGAQTPTRIRAMSSMSSARKRLPTPFSRWES